MGCFCNSLGWQMTFEAELFAFMNAIDSDSTNAVQEFTTFTIVSWRLLNRWLNCMTLLKEMGLKVYTHTHTHTHTHTYIYIYIYRVIDALTYGGMLCLLFLVLIFLGTHQLPFYRFFSFC